MIRMRSQLPLFFLRKILKARAGAEVPYNIPYALQLEHMLNLYYSSEIEPDTYR